MEQATQIIQRAKEIRARLRRPPNAVVDHGIDLKARKRPAEPLPHPPTPLTMAPIEAPSGPTLAIVTEVMDSTQQCSWEHYDFPEEETCGKVSFDEPPTGIHVTFKDIITEVSLYYRIRISDIVGPKRNPKLVMPRHVVCYLARKLTFLSLTFIGRQLSGRDHTTVIHAVRRIQEIVDTSDSLDKILSSICERIYAKHYARPSLPCIGQSNMEKCKGQSIQEP